jgi:hypothetical protein
MRRARKRRPRFSTYTGSFTAARFIEFCRKLMHDSSGPVYLVVDGHPAHKAKVVKQFVASTAGRLKLFVLPAYSSPQLNADEWVWKNNRVGGGVAPPPPTPPDMRARIRRFVKPSVGDAARSGSWFSGRGGSSRN